MDTDNFPSYLRVSAYISGCNLKWSDTVLSFDSFNSYQSSISFLGGNTTPRAPFVVRRAVGIRVGGGFKSPTSPPDNCSPFGYAFGTLRERQSPTAGDPPAALDSLFTLRVCLRHATRTPVAYGGRPACSAGLTVHCFKHTELSALDLWSFGYVNLPQEKPILPM
jgi:hypothetical protein